MSDELDPKKTLNEQITSDYIDKSIPNHSKSILTSQYENPAELSNSFIRGFFDTFNIKKAVKTLFSFTPFKITEQFIDGLILFCYFFVVFVSLNVLKFELNAATFTLFFIGIPILIELVVANSPSLKKYFSNEERAINFLRNFNSMTHEQIHQNINTINFSAKNLSLLLEIILKNKDEIPTYIIKDIVANNELTIDHINVLFTPENLKIFKEDNGEFIVSQLFRFSGSLNKENIKNLFSVFKDNENVIKMLVASQSESEILVRENPTDEKVKKYFELYQKEKKHYDFWLKFLSLKGINRVNALLVTIIFIGSILIIVLASSESTSHINDPSSMTIGFMFVIICIPFIMTTIINGIFIAPIFNFFREWHMRHLKRNILSV